MTRPSVLRSTLSRIAVIFLAASGLSLAYYIGVRDAHAQAAAVTAHVAPLEAVVTAPPVSSGLDVIGIFAVLGTVLGGLSLILSGGSIIMHAIAARTTNKVDDAIADGIDKVRSEVVKVISLLGAKDPATAAAVVAPPPKAPESGHVLLTVMATLAIGGIIGLATLGTAGCDGLKNAGTAVIDCTKANQTSIESLILEFRTLLQGNAPDWSAVEFKAIAAGEVIGGCALAQVVTGGDRSTLARAGDLGTGKATLEDFRSHYANGATFRTAFGDL